MQMDAGKHPDWAQLHIYLPIRSVRPEAPQSFGEQGSTEIAFLLIKPN
jgi:hypothetical protein